MEALDGLAEFGGLPSGELVDLLLQFGDLVVKFQQRFLRGLVLVEQILALREVFLSLVGMERQLVFQCRIARLKQHGIGDLDGIRDFLCFLSDMTLLGQRGQPLKLFFLEQADTVKITLNHFFLLVGFADFVIVRRDACDVVEHLSAFVGRHFRKARHVTLQHDVVAVRACIGRTKQAMEHLLRAVLAVELVGGDRVV